MDTNLLHIIKDYHRDLIFSNVCSEIVNRKHMDMYYVTTEADPFFSRLSRGRLGLPQISVTSVILNGIQMKMEPTGVNSRNRYGGFEEDDDEDEF